MAYDLWNGPNLEKKKGGDRSWVTFSPMLRFLIQNTVIHSEV
jgi:hypothetical protein